MTRENRQWSLLDLNAEPHLCYSLAGKGALHELVVWQALILLTCKEVDLKSRENRRLQSDSSSLSTISSCLWHTSGCYLLTVVRAAASVATDEHCSRSVATIILMPSVVEVCPGAAVCTNTCAQDVAKDSSHAVTGQIEERLTLLIGIASG